MFGRFASSMMAQIMYRVSGAECPRAATETANGNSYVYDANGNMTVRREVSLLPQTNPGLLP